LWIELWIETEVSIARNLFALNWSPISEILLGWAASGILDESNAVLEPIRNSDHAAGVVFDAGNGVHGFRYADEHCGTRLLPDDGSQL
jgi:hypothetical protein